MCIPCWYARFKLNLPTALCRTHTEIALWNDHRRFMAEVDSILAGDNDA